MRHSESEKETFKKKRKKKIRFQRKKESTIIAVRKNISPGNAGRLKLIMRKPIILKKNEDEKLKKSLN
jgi:hypothetical protein